MESPEKIYITKNLLGELRDGWDALPSDTFTNIEYIRTDVFIERATSYIKQHWVWNTKMIDGFENYIEEYTEASTEKGGEE